MKNFYFDLCAIPLFLLIIYTFFRRGLERYPEYRMFFLATLSSLVCAALDVAMEFTVNPVPLSEGAVVLGSAISFSYKLLRNACMVIYLLFVVSVTKTDHRFRSPGRRLVLWLPYLVVCVLLVQNIFTGNVFIVTVEGGYARGPLLSILYLVAAFYDFAGMAYCIACRKLIDHEKWAALMSVYVLTTAAVVVQLVYPSLMLELFTTALGLLLVVLLVLRPEETVDMTVGAQNWRSFKADLHGVIASGRKAEIVAFHLPFANESRSHLGDERYAANIADMLQAISRVEAPGTLVRIYYEQPSYIYVVLWDLDEDLDAYVAACAEAMRQRYQGSRNGLYWSDPRACLVRVPRDLSDEHRIIHLCHHFVSLTSERGLCQASDIMRLRDFEAWSRVGEILDRALNQGALQMHYQPIYDLRCGGYRSAEALARIVDPELGMVSPLVFIPAAERSGLILPLGAAIIEQVFRFISEHDLEGLGLDYLEINLSAEQCLHPNLPKLVETMQKRYGVDPRTVNFEITESAMGAADSVMTQNLERLVAMGYRFSLDDYGVGYSNMWRLRKLPLSLIKVDKSLVDDIHTQEGRIIMASTVDMVHGIGKETVVEGVEEADTLAMLKDLSCDYIQGFYFSRPLPADDFVAFLQEQSSKA